MDKNSLFLGESILPQIVLQGLPRTSQPQSNGSETGLLCSPRFMFAFFLSDADFFCKKVKQNRTFMVFK